MNKSKKLKLIKGIFSPEDAKEVLNNLYSSKIGFHNLKNFSSIERFGHPDKFSEKRIPELKASLAKLSHLVDYAIEKNVKLKLTSVVEIEIVEKK